MHKLFFKIKPSSYANTRQEGKFYVVFARTKLKSKCISICGVKLWNKLNSNISGIKSFKILNQSYRSTYLILIKIKLW